MKALVLLLAVIPAFSFADASTDATNTVGAITYVGCAICIGLGWIAGQQR